MAKRGFRNTVSVFGLVGAVALTTAPAFAQAGAEENGNVIVVTAQRREEASVDVPISITALSAETLEKAGVDQLGDIAKVTPALRFDSSGTFVQPTIRGVGTAITTSGGGPNVGIYVDGFFQSNPEVSDFQLMLVKSIQVLKGPQGTLFGRNTTGGAILVTTADPSTDPGAEFKVSYGRFNALKLQGYGTMGLAENVAMDVEGVYSRGDGFVTNIVNDDDKAGKYENWSVRAGLKADLTDSLSVLLRYTHSETDDPTALMNPAYVDTTGKAGYFSQISAAGRAFYQTYFGYSDSKGLPLINLALLPPLYPADLPLLQAGGYFPATWTAGDPSHATGKNQIASTNDVSFTNKSDSFQGTIKADLGFADLTSYTQYRKDVGLNLQDLDNSAANFFYAHLGIRNTTFSQELLFNSKSGGPLQWTVGLNYFQNRDTYIFGFAATDTVPFIPYGGSGTLTKSYAAFADATYEITPQLYLTVGGRYSHDVVTDAYFNTTFADTGYIGRDGSFVPLPVGTPAQTKIPVPSIKSDRFVPRVVLRYKPDDSSSVYASFTRGYKAGILNVGGSSLQPIKPETINAYEVGYKYNDRVLSFDAAAYLYDYKNLQVSSFQEGRAQIRNAATSRIWGIEANVSYRATEALTLNTGLAYTHARYRKFTNAPYYTYCDPVDTTSAVYCPGGALGAGALAQTIIDGSGFHMQRAPDFTATLGANYVVPLAEGKLTLSGNLYYTSKFYHDPTEQFEQKGYETLSLRAQWEDPSEHVTVAVYGDNVTNSRYRTVISYNTIGTGVAWSAPTTWGIQLGFKY